MTALDPGPLPVVLCVDDEPLLLQGLKLHLGRRFDVHTATSGAQALELFPQISPLAVVADMRMPEMTGVELFVRLRAIAPHVSRILLTGGTDVKGALASVREGGVMSFLVKPCPPADLVAALDHAVARTRELAAGAAAAS